MPESTATSAVDPQGAPGEDLVNQQVGSAQLSSLAASDSGPENANADAREGQDEVVQDKVVQDETNDNDNDNNDDNDDDDDDDDDEPKLKYQRLIGTVSDMLKKDAVSCMGVSHRFLAVGTHWGVVHIMDLFGTQVKRFQSHTATVNQVSIDDNGEFVASASDDGNIVVNSLYTTDSQTYNFRRPVKAVSLEPDYSRKQTRQFVSGGMAGNLVLTGKGWFGNTNVAIHSGDGPIFHVTWRGTLIFWSSEEGVNVYDTVSSQRFGKIERPSDSPRADLFRCSICWKSDTIVLIGWADSVKVVEVKERSKHDIASGLSPKYVEVVHQFRTDFIVSGIGPLGDSLVLLGYITDLSPLRNVDVLDSDVIRQKASPPEMHIVDLEGEAVANDVLSLIGYEHFQANDYRLVYLPSDREADISFYVVSPKDIVLSRPRDVDDHIQWLVERQRYAEALHAAEEAGSEYAGQSRIGTILDIGQKYMATLMADGKYQEAAESCQKLLRTDKTLWEHWIHVFAAARQLPVITPYIPLESPLLSPSVYDLILLHYLGNDIDSMLQIIQAWPTGIYRIPAIVNAVHSLHTQDPDNIVLINIMLELYERNRQWDMALHYGLCIYKPGILDLVQSHNLFQTLESNALLVLKYDKHFIEAAGSNIPAPLENMHIPESPASPSSSLQRIRAAVGAAGAQLLASNTDRVLPFQVVQQLQGNNRFLHVYLDALFVNDLQESHAFHPLQIELYAEYDYPRLMMFLRNSKFYSVPKAFEVCEARDLVPEMVLLLGKMGDSRRALMLIIGRLGDVERAIEFAKDQNDEDLWEEFLKYSMDKPAFIVGLLENLSAHIDPLRVIRLIPKGLHIPGLKDALIKIMTDCSIQKSLREGCERVLMGDTWESIQSLHRQQRRGIKILEDERCAMCGHSGTGSGGTSSITTDTSPDWIVFFCHHQFHDSCLNAVEDDATPTQRDKLNTALDAASVAARMRSSMSNTDRILQSIYARSHGQRVPAPLIPQERAVTPYRPGLICPICRSRKSGRLDINRGK
ncbi:hypothetical protein BASA61_005623 [Batrachochytrium salamandrivorans]|nr:hypothetical protein BASA61_005623 [Batrachochytrium salamandrivorans]KAH9275343.1 hypothetical protein BASA83_002116 [Batrachochytrium salamandrivorans]